MKGGVEFGTVEAIGAAIGGGAFIIDVKASEFAVAVVPQNEAVVISGGGGFATWLAFGSILAVSMSSIIFRILVVAWLWIGETETPLGLSLLSSLSYDIASQNVLPDFGIQGCTIAHQGALSPPSPHFHLEN